MPALLACERGHREHYREAGRQLGRERGAGVIRIHDLEHTGSRRQEVSPTANDLGADYIMYVGQQAPMSCGDLSGQASYADANSQAESSVVTSTIPRGCDLLFVTSGC